MIVIDGSRAAQDGTDVAGPHSVADALLSAAGEPAAQPIADAPFSPLVSRAHQMHPRLSDEDVGRMRRFGVVERWCAGQLLAESGVVGRGLLVLLRGHVTLSRRDGFGHTHRILDQGPNQFVGEVGALSGKPSLVDCRALDDVEALLLVPDRLRALLVAEADLGERIVRAMILRRVALVEGGSGPIIVGHATDARLVSLQGFLRRNAYPHTVLEADTDADAMGLIERITASASDLPLVLCPDGTVLRAPDEFQLATQLGWLPDFDSSRVYDVIVVGAGPAGLATAVYAASEGLSVAVFDCRAPGGQAGASARIENYLGFPTGISGQALAGRAFVQAQKFGTHVAIPCEIRALHCDASPIQIELASNQRLQSHTVVIATGAAYRRPAIAGIERFEGHGIYYWASPVEAKLCHGAEVVLVGGGNSAGQAAVYLASHTAHVHVMIRRTSLAETMSTYLIDRIAGLRNVTLHTETEIVSLEGDERSLTAVQCRTPAGLRQFETRHLFLFTGADPNTGWLQGCHVDTDGNGFILTGAAATASADADATADAHGVNAERDRLPLETSLRGVFAIGDVRASSTKRVAAAVGEGAAVVSQVHGVLALRKKMH